VLSFVAKPYLVPSGSMEETLHPGDRVLVDRLAYLAAGPASGDIVVFDAGSTWGPTGSEDDGITSILRRLGEVTGFGPSGPHTLIKRVIAGPGQTVSCCSADGRLLVDGVPLDEGYVFEDLPFEAGSLDCGTSTRSGRCLPEVTVPDDSYLVLGDHRSTSADSAYQCRSPDADPLECWRWMHRDQIVGRASTILWPISRWSGL
ncbi:MAG: signal peptidase I, partial [Microbacterium sp.]|uniref:signal peptidase I n=1 Tax=Microbacterium sp. TaxID=51671 RepID=UPI003BB2209F